MWDRFPSFVLPSLRFQLQQPKTFGKNCLLPKVMWKQVGIIGEQQENEQKILLHKEIFAYTWQWQWKGLNIVPYRFKSSHILLFLSSHKVMIMILHYSNNPKKSRRSSNPNNLVSIGVTQTIFPNTFGVSNLNGGRNQQTSCHCCPNNFCPNNL